jgi:hypothetical protein
MKRCPQCEFIYEDDQSLCDMDGILLVFDSQKLPKQAKTLKSLLRNRIVTVFAVLVLTTVLSLVYYVSTHQQKVARSTETPATSNATQPAASENRAVVTNEPENKISPSEPVPEPKPVVTKANSDSEPKKAAKSKSDQKKASSNQRKEDDSKIESFMKKTGRLLKKPFKF